MLRRTTVVAEDDDLAVLTREARERGTSLGRLLGRLVAREADEIRRGRRPRVGTFDVDASIADVVEADEPAGRPFRS